MAEPMGDFVLPKDESRPLVFIAAGVGITPYHSMVRWLSGVPQRREITLLHAVSSAEGLVFREVFESYGLTYIPLLSQAPPDWPGQLTGRLDTQRVLELTGKYQEPLVYLSGPEPLVESLYKGLKADGVDGRQLITDYFPGYTDV